MATYDVSSRDLWLARPWLRRRKGINAWPDVVRKQFSVSDLTAEWLGHRLCNQGQNTSTNAELWVKMMNRQALPQQLPRQRTERREDDRGDAERELAAEVLSIHSTTIGGIDISVGGLLSNLNNWPDGPDVRDQVEAVILVTKMGGVAQTLTVKLIENGALPQLLEEFRAAEAAPLPAFDPDEPEEKCVETVKCPECNLRLPEDDIIGQNAHIHQYHPTVVLERTGRAP